MKNNKSLIWRKITLVFIFSVIVFWSASSQANSANQINLEGVVKPNGKVKFSPTSQFTQQPRQKVILGLESERIQVKITDNRGQYTSNGQITLDLSQIKIKDKVNPTLRSYAIH